MLERLDEILPPKRVKYLLILSIVMLIIIYPIMGYFFLMSGNPGNVMESQLSFSAAYMRDYYDNIENIELYRIGETIDYGFMVSYGLLIISLALIIARKFDEGNFWRNSGYSLVPLGILAALLDAVENAFILAMLTDPSGFPDILAIMHSTFALIKWIILFLSIIWAVLAVIVRIIKK